MPPIIRAPEFPPDSLWLNTPAQKPLRFSHELQGHIVLLDFWTYGCINCLHVLPDLAHLEQKFANRPFTIIGVHSNKFANESHLDNVRNAVARLDIRHPVVIDPDHRIWDSYAVRAWPTLILINAQGCILGQLSGEGHRGLLETSIERALLDAEKQNLLAPAPLQFAPPPSSSTLLSFPTKVLPDPAHERLIILDTNHHRLLLTTWPNAASEITLTATIGTGLPGRTDGPFHQASFHRPRSAVLTPNANTLYLADTDNHLIRRIDLDRQQVSTFLGTGQQKFEPEAGKSGANQPLNSPWDVALHNNRLTIANAGQHQLFTTNLMTAMTEVLAGTGRENLIDGPALNSQFAQPSALALDPLNQKLYIADAESSALRQLDLLTKTVTTLLGEGLFTFGDTDGPAATARLQHPLGLALSPDATTLYIADTYNHKLKRFDLATRTLATIPLSLPLHEPTGLSLANNTLFLADTNHHRIVTVNLTTHQATPLTLLAP